MLTLLKTIKSIFTQRFVIYIIAVFFSLVLFNTTYLSLGTFLPLLTIILGLILFSNSPYKNKANSYNILYLGIGIITLFSTFLSGGDDFREGFKIFITALFVYKATKLKFSITEIKFFSLVISLSYFIYAVLVLQAIGGDTQYFGRAQIRILNSEIPLDPNVVSAVFILPIVISLYNLLYGKLKLLAATLIIFFLIAILALGSRGAILSLVISTLILIIDFLLAKKTPFYLKFLILSIVIIACAYAINFISEQENLFGLSRILEASDEADVSNGRTEIWLERLGKLLYSPIFGYGANYKVGGLHNGMACHNTFLQILHFCGIVGFCLFMKPTYRLYKRKSLPYRIKLSIYISVFFPLLFIDTLQERTIWNFLLFYSILSAKNNAVEGLLWDK